MLRGCHGHCQASNPLWGPSTGQGWQQAPSVAAAWPSTTHAEHCSHGGLWPLASHCCQVMVFPGRRPQRGHARVPWPRREEPGPPSLSCRPAAAPRPQQHIGTGRGPSQAAGPEPGGDTALGPTVRGCRPFGPGPARAPPAPSGAEHRRRCKALCRPGPSGSICPRRGNGRAAEPGCSSGFCHPAAARPRNPPNGAGERRSLPSAARVGSALS